MRLIIEPDYEKMSKWAANYVAKCINEAKPTAEKPFKLGCPTGSSPLGMYRELIALNKAGKVSFQNVMTFNMDDIALIREKIKEFRSELLRMSQEGDGDDTVFQLNVQLFPIGFAKKLQEKEK